MKILILPSARDDLVSGYTFYESQAEGLGSQFQETLISDIDALKAFSGVHPKFFGLYRSLSKRFPYAIYYSLEANTVWVRAVLDCRRDPEWTRRRVTGFM